MTVRALKRKVAGIVHPTRLFGSGGSDRRRGASPRRKPEVMHPHGIARPTATSPERKLGVDSATVTARGCRHWGNRDLRLAPGADAPGSGRVCHCFARSSAETTGWHCLPSGKQWHTAHANSQDMQVGDFPVRGRPTSPGREPGVGGATVAPEGGRRRGNPVLRLAPGADASGSWLRLLADGAGWWIASVGA